MVYVDKLARLEELKTKINSGRKFLCAKGFVGETKYFCDEVTNQEIYLEVGESTIQIFTTMSSGKKFCLLNCDIEDILMDDYIDEETKDYYRIVYPISTGFAVEYEFNFNIED